MALDDALMQQLLLLFEVELDEQIQLMTTAVFALEKLDGEERQTTLTDLLRSAHTIKGAANGIGQADIVDVIHRVESIISGLEKGTIVESSDLLTLLLSALDTVHAIFRSQRDKKSLGFDLNEHLDELDYCLEAKKARPQNPSAKQSAAIETSDNPAATTSIAKPAEEVTLNEVQSSSYSVSSGAINALSVVSDDIQTANLQFKQLLQKIHQLSINLDHLSSDFNEALIATSLVNQKKLYELAADFSRVSHETANLYNERRAFASQFNQLTHHLESSVNTLRLVPFATLLAPLYRVVYDLSTQQNKDINFVVEGGDIQIDRYLYKNLHTPLVHLITNAIDHGIEPIETREEQGKNKQAQLTLKITKQANSLLINIRDDGRGIDLKLIKQVAIDKLIITQNEAATYNDQQLLNLIFRSGFSSAKIISTTSGRGVGLDIVRTNLRKIKATIEVQSSVGKGSEFALALPAMLSSEQGLICIVAEQYFVLPAYSIEWVKNIPWQQLSELNGQTFLLDKTQQPVSCFYLAELLGLSTVEEKHDDILQAVFLSNGEDSIAVFVDQVVGEQEIIIKRFSYPLTKVDYAVGMTLLADGQLVAVLNAEELINKAPLAKLSKPFEKAGDTELGPKKVLVVDDSITTRTLICNILQQQGYAVTALINGLEAWQELQKNPHYELIVTDVEMPLLNGFELVKKIKSTESLSAIPTIIVSSLNSDEDKRQGVQVGANAYICKDSLDTDSLLAIVNQLI